MNRKSSQAKFSSDQADIVAKKLLTNEIIISTISHKDRKKVIGFSLKWRFFKRVHKIGISSPNLNFLLQWSEKERLPVSSKKKLRCYCPCAKCEIGETVPFFANSLGKPSFYYVGNFYTLNLFSYSSSIIFELGNPLRGFPSSSGGADEIFIIPLSC